MRRELAIEHAHRVQEDARRIHAPRQHAERFGVVVEVVRFGVGHGEHQRVAVPAARPARALAIVGRRRGHGAERDGGQVADVDAQLQSWGGRHEVGLPRSPFDVRLGEDALQALAVLPLD